MDGITVSGKITRIVDGDTFEMEVRLPFNIFSRETVRLLGVDTHETYGVSHDSKEYRLGIKEKQFVVGWVQQRQAGDEKYPLDVTIYEDGKFGRPLVELSHGNKTLNDVLLNNFNVEYEK